MELECGTLWHWDDEPTCGIRLAGTYRKSYVFRYIYLYNYLYIAIFLMLISGSCVYRANIVYIIYVYVYIFSV